MSSTLLVILSPSLTMVCAYHSRMFPLMKPLLAMLHAPRLVLKLHVLSMLTTTQISNSTLLSSGTISRRLACIFQLSSASADKLNSWWQSTTEFLISLSSQVSSVMLWHRLVLKLVTTSVASTFRPAQHGKHSVLVCGTNLHSSKSMTPLLLISQTKTGRIWAATGASS